MRHDQIVRNASEWMVWDVAPGPEAPFSPELRTLRFGRRHSEVTAATFPDAESERDALNLGGNSENSRIRECNQAIGMQGVDCDLEGSFGLHVI